MQRMLFFLDIRCGENRIVAVVYGIAHMFSAIALRMHATREPQHPPSRTLIERVLSLSTKSLGVSVPKTVDFKLLWYGDVVRHDAAVRYDDVVRHDAAVLKV